MASYYRTLPSGVSEFTCRRFGPRVLIELRVLLEFVRTDESEVWPGVGLNFVLKTAILCRSDVVWLLLLVND